MRWARIVFSLVFFTLLSAQFLDIFHRLPDSWYRYHPAQTQIIPSLLNLLGGGGVLAGAAFITFTVTTLVFGRVYCSFFCPLGIGMDIVRWFAKFPGKNRFLKKSALGRFCARALRLRWAPAWKALRIGAVGLAALLILFGLTSLLGFLEPYSLFGKVFGLIVFPGLSLANNGVSDYMISRGVYTVAAVNGDVRVSMAAFGLALLILAGVSALSIWRGRIYCNTLCPVGGFLGWLARFSLLRLELVPENCTRCGLCERECKAQCIETKSRALDFSRCVLCFDCVATCPRDGVQAVFHSPFGLAEKKKPRKAGASAAPLSSLPAAAGMNRRQFVRSVPAVAALFCSAAKLKEGQSLSAPPDPGGPYEILPDATPYWLRGERADKRLTVPPGGVSIKNFFYKCTGCQICVASCPSQILKPSLTEWGLAGIMQPYMDFTKGYCVHECTVCTQVCPSDALRSLSVEEKKVEKLGTAIFREDLCIVKTNETDCSACGEHCPVTAIEMLPYNLDKHLYIPHVHEEVCIGCGACEYVCPVLPHKALVVQGANTIQKAKLFDESMRLHKVQEPPESSEPVPELDTENPFPF